MTISDLVMVIAVLAAPLLAIQASVYLDKRRERRNRQVAIFRTLMATRGSALTAQHVEALNMIDVEFHGNDRASRAVLEAWKAYLHHLGQPQTDPAVWRTRREDLFVDLLYSMGQRLGFYFDKTAIRSTSYVPVGLGDIERDQQTIRTGLADVFRGKRAIPIWAWVQAPPPAESERLPPPDEPVAEVDVKAATPHEHGG